MMTSIGFSFRSGPKRPTPAEPASAAIVRREHAILMALAPLVHFVS